MAAVNWTKDSAINELQTLADQTVQLKTVRRFTENHIRWMTKVKRFLEEVFGTDSDYYITFIHFSWHLESQAIIGGPERPRESMNPQLGIERVNQEAYIDQLGMAKGLLLAAKDELQSKDLVSIYKGKNTGPEASILLKIFGLIEHKLRKVIRKAPSDEYELQEAMENLLIGADIPYSRETDSIEYSTKTYIPDFTITKADLAIDLKLCKTSTRSKDIIAEINDDILAYKTKYGNIVFIVYDLGIIRDIDRFIDNFQELEGVKVIVVKH